LAVAASSAHAQITAYSGEDVGASPPGPYPNSNAAAATFDAAATLFGPETIITFEPPTPLGAFSSLSFAPGVTLTGSNISAGEQTIINTPLGTPVSVFGFNTTPGGSQWLSLFGGSATFNFATPVNYFGAYLTGVQLGGEAFQFTDSGGSESVAIPNPGSGAEFVGFTDTNSFSSVTINVGGDIVGVDDVRVEGPAISSSTTPEPSSLAMFAISVLTGGGFLRRRLRSHRTA